jgi:hypothetical protein
VNETHLVPESVNEELTLHGSIDEKTAVTWRMFEIAYTTHIGEMHGQDACVWFIHGM